jgi:hypothetical protein
VDFCESHEWGSFGLTVRVVILGASIGDQVTVFKSILSRKSYYSKLLNLHVGMLVVFEGGFCTQYLNFHFMGRLNGGMHISQSEIYNLDEAVFDKLPNEIQNFGQ